MVISISGCSGSSNDKPKEVLDQDKMVEVMVDVHLAEAVLTRLRGQGEDVKKLTDDYYQQIFDKHHTSREQFDTSFAYYQRNLDVMDHIYEEVITELNKMEREAELIQRQDNDADDKNSKPKSEEDDEKPDLRMDLKKDIK